MGAMELDKEDAVQSKKMGIHTGADMRSLDLNVISPWPALI